MAEGLIHYNNMPLVSGRMDYYSLADADSRNKKKKKTNMTGRALLL